DADNREGPSIQRRKRHPHRDAGQRAREDPQHERRGAAHESTLLTGPVTGFGPGCPSDRLAGGWLPSTRRCLLGTRAPPRWSHPADDASRRHRTAPAGPGTRPSERVLAPPVPASRDTVWRPRTPNVPAVDVGQRSG